LEKSIALQKEEMDNATGLADAAKSKADINDNKFAKRLDSIRGDDDEVGQWGAMIEFNQ
jgi:hypothetical protein